jgi:hypothetical protein
MIELIPTINEIVKFGLQSNLTVTDKEKLLEKNLVKIYNLYFDIEFEYDETDYPEFDKSKFPDVSRNVGDNFKDFGYYELQNDLVGNAIDDLTDIIFDFLEIKWRIETNSLADGLWYFQLIFRSHTQQHILDLLNFMKQKNG